MGGGGLGLGLEGDIGGSRAGMGKFMGWDPVFEGIFRSSCTLFGLIAMWEGDMPMVPI